MKKAKAVFFDGMKSVSAWNVDDVEGWTYTGGDVNKSPEELYFANVAWLYRAVKDRSNMVGRMPFAIKKGDNEVDSSATYKNVLVCMPDPINLLKKIEQSLTMVGKAFVRLERNSKGFVSNLKYLNPATITEKYDKNGILEHYERKVNNVTKIIPPEDMLAFYDADYTTEVGCGTTSAAKAALASAGVLFNVDKFLSNYFERGAIKATILTTKGYNREEASKLKQWWQSFIQGNNNSWSTEVLNGDAIDTTVIGEGLESLSNTSLTTERRQNIAAAIGVPESRMWSSAANYATSQQDEKNYLLGTIIPECDLIAGVFNSKLFTAENKLAGYSIDYDYESLDAFQKDTKEQAESAKILIDTGMPALMAYDKVGIDLSKEERAELEKIQAEKDKKPEPVTVVNNTITQAEQDEPVDDMTKDLTNWQRKATKAVKSGKSASVKFESEFIPDWMKNEISNDLLVCESAEDVKQVFGKKREQGFGDVVGMLRELMAVINVSPQSASS